MQKFNVKSIILGVGIGIVVTSAMGMVYSASGGYKSEMTGDEIIREAEKLGMVMGAQIFITPSATAPEDKPESTVTPEPTPSIAPTPDITPTPVPTPVPVSDIIINVNPGDTAVVVANRLVEAKVISDGDAFVNEMINSGAAYKIIARSYRFREGMDAKEVIQVLLTRE